jgi:mono/diheme cytochrome c family protein
LERAVTRGVTPDGLLVRKPMPTFARLDRTDIEAIYKYLQSVPKVRRQNMAGGHPLEKAHKDDTPEALFVNVGCVTCHGENGPFRDKLSAARDKSDVDVANWILDPQKQKPGSAMPSFDKSLDREQATKLAQYVKSLARGQGG